MANKLWRVAGQLAATAVGTAAGVYGAYVATTWSAYGKPAASEPGEDDPLLDRFMPDYEVVERQAIRVAAPADVVFRELGAQQLMDMPVPRAIFRARELLFGIAPGEADTRGLLDVVQSIGWRVLAEVPDREVVVGAVTQPWHGQVTFRGIEPAAFASFAEPGYAKIAWTLRADPDGNGGAIARTETRVSTTDAVSRAKFRRYWSFLSPGIILIRRAGLRAIKRAAEASGERVRAAADQARAV